MNPPRIETSRPERVGFKAAILWIREEGEPPSLSKRLRGSRAHEGDLMAGGSETKLTRGNGCVIQVFCTGMSLLAREPVKLSFIIDSLDEFQAKLKTLQRAQRVYDPQAEADIPEWTRHSLALRNALVALDCHDAKLSYFETAGFIYGEERAREAWDSPSRAMKDEMRRALARGRDLRDGGYATLLGPVENALLLA